MTTIYDLNKDIKSYILFNYLDIASISACYLTSKIFHCLNTKQLIIYKQARKGLYNNIEEGNIDICKWLQTNYKINESHLMHACIKSCENGFLKTTKWSYYLLTSLHPAYLHKTTYKYATCAHNYRSYLFLVACQNGYIDVCKWAWGMVPYAKIIICIFLLRDSLVLVKIITLMLENGCIV